MRRTFEFKDMKLTNKMEDVQQLFEGIEDKVISMITVCGTTNEVCKYNLTNAVKEYICESL